MIYHNLWIYKNVYLKQIRRIALNSYLNRIKSRKKPLYIHINKTAGSSIAQSLGVTGAHHTLLEYEAYFESKFNLRLPKDTDIWCSIRNPFEKVVSEYFYRIKTNQNDMAVNPISFKDWVYFAYDIKHPFYRDREIMFSTQSNWIFSQNEYNINFIRFESLYNDFNKLVSSNNFMVEKMKWEKKSNHRHYTEYYDEISRKIIEREFAIDLERFKYIFA